MDGVTQDGTKRLALRRVDKLRRFKLYKDFAIDECAGFSNAELYVSPFNLCRPYSGKLLQK